MGVYRVGESFSESLALACFTNNNFADCIFVLATPYGGRTVFANNIFAHSNRSAKFAKHFSREINPLYSIPSSAECSYYTELCRLLVEVALRSGFNYPVAKSL